MYTWWLKWARASCNMCEKERVVILIFVFIDSFIVLTSSNLFIQWSFWCIHQAIVSFLKWSQSSGGDVTAEISIQHHEDEFWIKVEAIYVVGGAHSGMTHEMKPTVVDQKWERGITGQILDAAHEWILTYSINIHAYREVNWKEMWVGPIEVRMWAQFGAC